MSEPENLKKWIGKSRQIFDIVDLATCQRMAATLDQQATFKEGDALPPLWHWCFFHLPQQTADLDRDGHAVRGDFLPPVALPRRMWAGGRLNYYQDIPIGGKVRKTSKIKSIKFKQGQSGELCFVTVEHRYVHQATTCLVEEHDIVYRQQSLPGGAAKKPQQAEMQAQWSRKITPSSVMMFRYSALTFNGHRIHYDRDYCRDVENYPGLVFHGPLTATLLLDLAIANNPQKILKSFEFRAVSPVFDTAPFTIRGENTGKTSELQAVLDDGVLAMTAQATFS